MSAGTDDPDLTDPNFDFHINPSSNDGSESEGENNETLELQLKRITELLGEKDQIICTQEAKIENLVSRVVS